MKLTLLALSCVILAGLASPGYCQSPAVTSPLRYAAVVSIVPPEYTPEARAAGLQGSVLLSLDVGPAGQIGKIQVIQPLGLGLDRQAVEAVKKWQLRPAEMNGQPIAVKQSVEVKFTLDPVPSWRIDRETFQIPRHAGDRLQGVTAPRLIRYQRPDEGACPANSRGSLVEVEISKQGNPTRVSFVGEQDSTASAALSQVMKLWEFEPARMNGETHDSIGAFAMSCGASPATGPLDQMARTAAPSLLWKVEPDYSEAGLHAKRQGSVQIHLVVDVAGRATSLLIVDPLGYGLDEQAMEAVTKWRFKPALKAGTPVSNAAVVTVNFKML